MTTIPYDKGWKITVDGKEVEPIKALGSLVAFYVDGEIGETHDFELVYRPNTFVIGSVVSLLSLALLIAIIILEKRIRKIKHLGTLVSVCAGDTPNANTNETASAKDEEKRSDDAVNDPPLEQENVTLITDGSAETEQPGSTKVSEDKNETETD